MILFLANPDIGSLLAVISIAVGVLIVIVVAAVLTRSVLRRRLRRRVADASAALAALVQLNERFGEAVAPLAPFAFRFDVRVDSKAKFDAFDLGRRFRQEVMDREPAIVSEMDARRTALRHFLDYEMRLGPEVTARLGQSSHPGLRQDRFDAIERELYDEAVLERPTPQAEITGTVRYRSPQGRNSHARSATWTYEDLRQALGLAREEKERLSTTQYLRQRERSLMTPSLRVDVLRRDGYRCRACGASSSDIQLHVDHIVPVSHGGRTEMSNLQTLCQSCNLGKSNRFVG